MKKAILIGLALASCTIAQSSNKDGETRTATKVVDVSSTDVITVLGKHKSIKVDTWDKNQVEVVATINFYGEPNNRMQDFLNNWEEIVKGNIRKQAGELVIDGEIEEPNKVQIGSKRFGIQFDYSEKQLSIEYVLKVPASNRLKIRTSYKGLWMRGDYDDVEIDAYSSDFEGGTFKKAKLKLKYGEANIKSIGDGKLESYENDLEIGDVQEFEIDDKYSELNFKNVEVLKIQGYESDIRAVSIGKINANLKYGDMEVEEKIGLGTFTLYEYDIQAQSAGNLKFESSKYSNFKFDRANEIRLLESYEDELQIRFLNIFEAPKTKYGEYTIDELGKRFTLNGYEDDTVIRKISEGAEELELNGKYLTLDINLNGRPFALNADTRYGKIEYDESKLDVKKYIKENDKIYIEAGTKSGGQGFKISLTGYEIKANID